MIEGQSGGQRGDEVGDKQGEPSNPSPNPIPKNKQPAVDDLFEDFWKAYPRKVAKGKARKAWDKATKNVAPQTIIEAGEQYAKSVAGSEAKYIAHPTTWLNAERWEDDPEPASEREILPGTREWAARSIKWMEKVPEWQAMANRGEITDREFNRRVAEAQAAAP
tara:strand:+ start:992 stop:1483 length:492 start_codon:yes stop_codon:yes gene_type:complete